MVFAVSEGTIRSIEKPTYQAPRALRLTDSLSQDYATIYRTQPEVRTVVDFLARNVAQLGLHTYRRVSDTDRERLRDHPLARMLARPNSYTTRYRMIRSLVSDMGIYDFAVWLKTREDDRDALVRVPPRMVRISDDDNWLRPETFIIEGNRGRTPVDAKNIVYFRGYNPEDERYGLSPIETLRRALAEEYAAGQMREQTLRNGARMSGYITRPQGADWSDAARERFRSGWRSQYSGWSATEAGGTPVLEDGMQFVPAGQSAVDLQYVEARKLTREEVAAAYFIPPPMIGILDNASFSNITEQHKMLYQDTLGPWLQEIQQEIELQILPGFEDNENVYVEFNMEEKLRGSFEEQAAQLSSSVGAPFMSRAEARSRLNLPSIVGAEELVVPLNVLIGGQASPRDSGTQNERARVAQVKAAPVTVKATPNPNHAAKAAEVLLAFFGRQQRSVLSALGSKDPGWWDGDRWDRELGAELLALGLTVSTAAAKDALDRIGLDVYDVDRTTAFLKAVADSRAGMINAATRDQVAAILAGDGPDGVDSPAHVFEVAKSSRAAAAGVTLATTFATFGVVEAGKQNGAASKTWLVASRNPRPEHAAMNGQTVGIDDKFSNSADWPGDPVLGADGVAGCTCIVEVRFNG